MEGLQQLLALIDHLAHLVQVEVAALEQLLALLFPYVEGTLQAPGHRACQREAVESAREPRPRPGWHSTKPFPIQPAQHITGQKTMA